MNFKANNLVVDDKVAVGETWLFLRFLPGFDMEASKGGFLMGCHEAKQKIPKSLKDSPFGDVFLMGTGKMQVAEWSHWEPSGWQTAKSCRWRR